MDARKKRMEKADVMKLLDKSVCEMTSRVAKITLVRTNKPKKPMGACSTLMIKTIGDCELSLAFSIQDSLLAEIVRNMKSGEVVGEEAKKIYITEYYNILCGYFVSHYNQRQGLKTRFGIPELIRGCYMRGMPEREEIRLFFESAYGQAEFSCQGHVLKVQGGAYEKSINCG